MNTLKVITDLVEESQKFSRRYIEQLMPHIFEFERLGVAKTADDYYHLVEPIVSMVKAHDEQIWKVAQSSPEKLLKEAMEAERSIRSSFSEVSTVLLPHFPLKFDLNGKESGSSDYLRIHLQ